MKLKKWLTLSLAGALLVGGMVTASAAELDTAWYAAKNPDVVAELGDSPEALRNHYEMFGRKEGREANDHDMEAKLRKLFKAEEYAALYPDVAEALGEDAEALFAHYIGYGLLEARRPAEKVPQAVAATLKTAVEKALAEAGIAAAPGSAQLVEIITGTIPADEGGAAVQAALAQAAPAVEKAVAAAVEETTNPTPSSGGGSGSSSSSSPVVEKSYSVREVTINGRNITLKGENDTDTIMICEGNKNNGFYWFAVFVPKTEYTGEEEDVNYWLKTGDSYENITRNAYTYSGLGDNYGFLLGAKDDEDEIANDTEVTYQIALAPVGEDGAIDESEAIWEGSVTVTFTRPEVTIYEDLTVTDGEISDLGTGKVVKAVSGDGSTEKPYVIGSTSEPISIIKANDKNKIDNTYWYAVDVMGGSGGKSITKVPDLSEVFNSNLKKDTLFGFGDNGIGDGDTDVAFALGNLHYMLKKVVVKDAGTAEAQMSKTTEDDNTAKVDADTAGSNSDIEPDNNNEENSENGGAENGGSADAGAGTDGQDAGSGQGEDAENVGE